MQTLLVDLRHTIRVLWRTPSSRYSRFSRWPLVKDGLLLAGAGVLGGLICAAMVQEVFRNLLYGVSPTDSWTTAGTAFLLFFTGALASYIPARRAASVDPMEALRYE